MISMQHSHRFGQNQPGDRPAAHRGSGHRQSAHSQDLPQARRHQSNRGGAPGSLGSCLNLQTNSSSKQTYK